MMDADRHLLPPPPFDHRVVRVVHLIARLNDGGPARVLAALARVLAPQGIETVILAGRCEDHEVDLAPRLREDGITVLDLPRLGRSIGPGADLATLGRVLGLVRDLRPAVLHTHTAKAGALGRIAARLLGQPCLHTYHGHVLHGYFPPGMSAAILTAERLLAGPCHHQALTRSQQVDLARIGRPDRWHVLPVPVPAVVPQVAAWHDALDRPVVGFLGRLVAVKDPALWSATVRLLEARHGVLGVVAGDGPLREAVSGHRHLGMVPAGELLARCRVLLMTSRNEGQPLAAVEAASLGVPVVAPPVGGLADLARDGLVTAAARTPEALADAVARLLPDSVLRDARIARARAVAATFTPEALAPAYARLYRQVAG